MNYTALALFCIIVIATLFITYYAAKRTKNANQFYTAGGGLTGWQNGLAIGGDFMSASSFLGIVGGIALTGFDGLYLLLGALVSYLVVMYLVAEPLRNLGKYTLADMITARFNTKKVRGAAAVNTIVISIFYMIAQLVGAGVLIKLLLGIGFSTSLIIVGVLMTVYVLFGGMTATSWVQIIKASLLMVGTFILFILVLSKFNFNIMAMFDQIKHATPLGEKFLNPGIKNTNGLDAISLNIGLLLGTAGLPHVLMRFFTVQDAKTARKSVTVATWVISIFYVMAVFLGFGATLLVGTKSITQANPAGNMAAPLLAQALGGNFMFAFICAVAFATILAVVAGIVLSGASAFAHDFYNEIIRGGKATEKEQVRAARIAAISVAVISIILALFAKNLNVAFLGSLALTLAASANLPVILYTIYWRKFNTAGAITSMVVGLAGTIILVFLSPNVWDPEGHAILIGKPIFPLASPGIVSIPLSFIGGYLGTVLSRKKANKEDFDKVLVQSNLGKDV
ncbi:cation acetate symporter [Scopulibacillus cellulosilyticus]|uniref:Cation acetate symporter n=1 Tax=Scopulibacillus cellulosilyticus TaxID=2665665 RepID=A0ABW2Q624_9BACL